MSAANEEPIAPPNEVAKGEAETPIDEGAKEKDVDIPFTRKGDNGNDDIPKLRMIALVCPTSTQLGPKRRS